MTSLPDRRMGAYVISYFPPPSTMSSASSSASPSPHSSLSPSPSLGGSSSANSSNTSLPSKNSKIHGSRVKPVNIFSNDGSFLERFQRIKRVRGVFPFFGYAERAYMLLIGGRGEEESGRGCPEVVISVRIVYTHLTLTSRTGSVSLRIGL